MASTNKRKALFSYAQKFMYFILKQGRFYTISVNVHLKLFNCILQPVLFYGSEIGVLKSCPFLNGPKSFHEILIVA